MASITLRKNFYHVRVRRNGWPAESRGGFRTKSEAEVWARDVESKMDRGIYVSLSDSEKTTFGDLVRRFETEYAPFHYRKRDDSNETWRFQLRILVRFFGAYSIAALDQGLVASYRDSRLKGCDSRAVGESSVRKELYMLSKVLGFGEMECGITLPRGNPVQKIRKPRDSKSRDRRLSAEEWTRLLEECRKSRNVWLAPAVEIAVETCMRQGEMLSLGWQQIDKKNRLALLLDPERIKTGEARAVPLSKRALALLDVLPRALKGNIFQVDRITLSRALARACHRAKITDYRWHDLRHEGISRLAERGDFSLMEMAAVSGHKTLQMLKRYTHLQAAKLAEKLNN